MLKLMAVLAAVVVIAAPAQAQMQGQGRGKGSKRPESTQQTEEKKKEDAAAEKAYKDALHSIPEQKTSDPWAKMR